MHVLYILLVDVAMKRESKIILAIEDQYLCSYKGQSCTKKRGG